MSAPKIYRFDDPNAPRVTKDPVTLIAALKACLIDGYNLDATDETTQRPAAGWKLEFEDPTDNGVVVRQGGGNLRVARIKAVYTSSRYYLSLTASDDATGYGEEYEIGSFGSVTAVAYGPSTSVPWVIIASDKFFYFIVPAQHSYDSTLDYSDASVKNIGDVRMAILCFGDGVPIKSEDSNLTVAGSIGYDGNWGFAAATSVTSSSISPLIIRNNIEGDAGASNWRLAYGAGPSSYFGRNDSNANTALDTDNLAQGVQPLIITVVDRAIPRGFLPGIYAPFFTSESYECFLVCTADDGKEFMAVKGNVEYTSDNRNFFTFLIRTDDWEDD